MSNPYTGTQYALPDNPELPQIMRRQKMAEQLLQQSQEPLQGQMVSGHYVAPSITQYLAKGLQGFLGRKDIKESDERMAELARQLRGQEQGDIQKFMELSQGKPAQTIQPTTAVDDEGNPMPSAQAPAQAPNMGAAYAALLGSKSPGLQQAGMQGVVQLPRLQAAQQEKEAERAFRAQQLQEQHNLRMQMLQEQNATRQQMAEEQRQHQMQMAKLQAGLRPEPLQPVLVPGSQTPVLMPRSQAIGMQPWNPAAAKTQQQVEDKEKGKQTVSDVVGELKGYYDTLKEEGGIPTTGGNPLTNLGARLANTGVGQAMGSVAGTKAQQARESVSQTRPLLMAAIKNATGMSSQQMNSNAELMFYMQAATDPSKGYEANMDAIKRLDKMYGLGLSGESDAGKPSTQGRVVDFGSLR